MRPCSLVALSGKLSEAHLQRLLKRLSNKLIEPRNKNTKNEDAACIAVKAVAADLPESEGRILVHTCIPILLSGLTDKVRRLASHALQ